MSNANDFVIINGMLEKYTGTGGDVCIPDGVKEIGNSAFSCRLNLQTITIPNSVTAIGDAAFFNCNSLLSITIPDSVTTIGNGVFSLCLNLQSITLTGGVTTIGNHAFTGCKNLQVITIPDSVTRIGNYAFSNCSSLQSITIPDSVTTIGECAFSGCDCLQYIVAPGASFDQFTETFARRVAAIGYMVNSNQYTDTETVAAYQAYISSQKKKLLLAIFKNDLVPAVAYFCDTGKITGKNFDKDFLQPAMEAGATQCVAYLLDWKAKNMGAAPTFRL